MTIFGSPALPA